MSTPLPPELVSLVHHVTLNGAGWWDHTLQRLILGLLWLHSKPLSATDIHGELSSGHASHATSTDVNRAIEHLLEQGAVQVTAPETYRISESSRKQLAADIAELADLENKAKKVFQAAAATLAPSLASDAAWQRFQSELLLPLVSLLGARLYDFLTGASRGLDESVPVQKYLDTFEPTQRDATRQLVLSFLSPTNADVRAYVLRHLNAHFCVAAGGLSPSTIDTLRRSLAKPISLKILIDTNFLYAFLGLDDRVSEAAAEALREVIKNAEGRVQVKLYVTNATLAEAQRNLADQMSRFSALRITPNMAHAALGTHISSVARRFIEECQTAGRALSAQTYFSPYVEHLVQVLRGKGVEPYNADLGDIAERKEVMDDLASQTEYERRKYAGREKSYNTLKHDVVLWHLAHSSRPSIIESPTDANLWVVTVDHRLLAFDAFKRNGKIGSVPVCVHPLSLIQMLQFWVPRTDAFENAMMDGIRLPVLAADFDQASERLTLKILEHLSRFEDIGDLPTDTVSHILLSDALRQRLVAEPNVEAQINLIRDELLAQHKKLTDELAEAMANSSRKDGEIARLRESVEDVQRVASARANEIAVSHATLAAREKELQDVEDRARRASESAHQTKQLLEQEQSLSAKLESRLELLEKSSREREAKENAFRERREFCLYGFGALAIAAIVAVPIAMLLTAYITWSLSRSYWLTFFASVLVTSLILQHRGRKRLGVASWPLFSCYNVSLKYALGVLLVGVIVAVLKDEAKDSIRQLSAETKLREANSDPASKYPTKTAAPSATGPASP